MMSTSCPIVDRLLAQALLTTVIICSRCCTSRRIVSSVEIVLACSSMCNSTALVSHRSAHAYPQQSTHTSTHSVVPIAGVSREYAPAVGLVSTAGPWTAEKKRRLMLVVVLVRDTVGTPRHVKTRRIVQGSRDQEWHHLIQSTKAA